MCGPGDRSPGSFLILALAGFGLGEGSYRVIAASGDSRFSSVFSNCGSVSSFMGIGGYHV